MDQPEGFLFLHCSEFREWAYWRVKDISDELGYDRCKQRRRIVCPLKSRRMLGVYIPRMV